MESTSKIVEVEVEVEVESKSVFKPKYFYGRFICRSDFSPTTVKHASKSMDQQTHAADIILVVMY
jgi:hypothetical protein